MTPESATRALTELRRLKPNMDLIHGRMVTPEALQTAHVLLTEEPMIAPCSTGGIILQWDTRGVSFEVRIMSDGREDLD